MQGAHRFAIPLAGVLIVFALSAHFALGAPASFVHPDEQRAAYQALATTGSDPTLPEDLEPIAHAFRPYKTPWRFDEVSPLETGYRAMGGTGFAYPLYLAAFIHVSPEAAYLAGAFSLVLLYVGSALLLDPRRPTSWLLAGFVLAIPPAVLQTTVLFSNLPGLAFHVLAVGIAAHAWRTRRAIFLVPAFLSGYLAAAVRTEYYLSLGLLALVLLVAWGPSLPKDMRWRFAVSWSGGVAACLAVGVGIFYWATGSVGLPNAHVGRDGPATNLTSIGGVWERASALWGGILERSTADAYVLSADQWLLSFVPALLIVAAVGAWRPPTLRSPAWLLLPLAVHGASAWLLSAGVDHYAFWCACIDASHPRYFLPIYAALALFGAMGVAHLLDTIPLRSLRAALALGVTLFVVVPGVGHAYAGEQGIAWIHETREWQATYDDAADRLPERAVVAGNYLSKIVYSRPVLVPDQSRQPFVRHVLTLDEIARPVFVSLNWLEPGKDERGEYGRQIVAHSRLVLVHSGVKDFYEVKVVNARLGGVFDLEPRSWESVPDQRALQATADRAYFRIPNKPDGAIPLQGEIPARATIRIVYLDDEPDRAIRVGYENFDSNSTNQRAVWSSEGTNRWIERSFTVEPGYVVTGALYVEGRPLIRALEVSWR